MAKFVVGPDVVLMLAQKRRRVPNGHRLLAPTLLRSQVLALLFAEVNRGSLTRRDANEQLDYMRRLQIRLLGDRVLQRVAWEFAATAGWKDTFLAEYLALTRLQADALVTVDAEWTREAATFVPVATVEQLLKA